MRKAILMMLLAGASSSAAAEWVEVYRGDTETAIADPTTSRRIGNLVQMWDMKVVCIDCDNVQAFGSKRYGSRTRQGEYDCKEVRSRTIFATGYSGNMNESKTVDFAKGPSEWQSVTPGSTEEALWKFACGKL